MFKLKMGDIILIYLYKNKAFNHNDALIINNCIHEYAEKLVILGHVKKIQKDKNILYYLSEFGVVIVVAILRMYYKEYDKMATAIASEKVLGKDWDSEDYEDMI